MANRDKEYQTTSGRAPSGMLSAISRKSTQISTISRKTSAQVAPVDARVQEEASRITPVEQSTTASPTPTAKERPRSKFLI